MFNFINLGMDGYRRVVSADLVRARILSRALEKTGYFTILSNIHIPAKPDSIVGKARHGLQLDDDMPGYYTPGLPVVSFRFTDEIKAKYPKLNQAWVQSQLRAIGWIVPK